MLFGDKTKPILTGFAALLISGVLATGVMVDQTWPYYTAAALAGIHLVWQVGSHYPPCIQGFGYIFLDWNSQAGHTVGLFGEVQGKQVAGVDPFGRNYIGKSCEISMKFCEIFVVICGCF